METGTEIDRHGRDTRTKIRKGKEGHEQSDRDGRIGTDGGIEDSDKWTW